MWYSILGEKKIDMDDIKTKGQLGFMHLQVEKEEDEALMVM